LGREPDETAVLDPAALVGAAAIIGWRSFPKSTLVASPRGGEGREGRDLLRGGGQSLVFDTESAVTGSLSGGGRREGSQPALHCPISPSHLTDELIASTDSAKSLSSRVSGEPPSLGWIKVGSILFEATAQTRMESAAHHRWQCKQGLENF
jgi:hypothetical protein